MQCKQAHEYAHIKCNQSKFMSLLPLLVCFSCLRILIHLFSPKLLPLCPCPCPTSISLIFHILSLPLYNLNLNSLYNISPFVINFHKRCESQYKGVHRGRWLTLESCIFYGHHHMWWNDTACNPWDTSCRIFDLDTNWWGTSPYVNASFLISLSLCIWGNFFLLMIT